MLVLSRRVDQRIRIGSDIVVTVVRIGPDKVRLGFEAPHGVAILREELFFTGEEVDQLNQVIDRALAETAQA
jgi:carbon storage regulator